MVSLRIHEQALQGIGHWVRFMMIGGCMPQWGCLLIMRRKGEVPSVILKVLPHGCIDECSHRRPALETVLLSFIIFVIAGILGLTMGRYALAQQPLPMSVRVQSVRRPELYEYAVLFVWFIHGLIALILVFTVLRSSSYSRSSSRSSGRYSSYRGK